MPRSQPRSKPRSQSPALSPAPFAAAATLPLALLLAASLLLWAMPAPAADARPTIDPATGVADVDNDGIEDLLQQWRRGEVAFAELRVHATAAATAAREVSLGDAAAPMAIDPAALQKSAEAGARSQGRLRLLCLDVEPGARAKEIEVATKSGSCRTLFTTSRFGGVTVLEVDEAGLRALVDAPPQGRLLLDRDGVPALDASRRAVGAHRVETGAWKLGDDGTFSLAILDSGCDTAHNDLGDPTADNVDGPPPLVGDAGDWYPATSGWPLFPGYKVIGWHDVTDDFPAAAGPWDYNHHGTSLASVAVGRGSIDSAYRGVAPGARLVVVKCYDFDEVWHAWAGDYLAACDWVLDQHEVLRIGTVLMAVNWDAELGIAGAVTELANAGLTPVVAMGNYGTTGYIGWPARSPGALTVGAVNDNGAVAAFSGRGGWITTKPDIMAPGGGLVGAAGRITCADSEPNDTYSGRWGTSLAAAHVAGALHLLDEALNEQAASLPPGLLSVRTRQAVLRLTAAPVPAAETADGTSTTSLPAGTAPRDDRGWGLLRVDAAAQALLVPLRPGVDQTDSLFTGSRQPVVARRLDLQPRVRYLVEALPVPGLDIELVLADPRDLDSDPTGAGVVRLNQGGTGTSEYTYATAGPESWQLLAVKRLSGQGAVVLRVREASSFTQQGASRLLPGVVSAGPSVGTFAGFAGPSFVVPSLVAADPVARSVNLLGADGAHRPGWPVFVFPHVSAQGGLNLPLVWDFDSAPGDEIVLSSAYGSVYFFNASGTYQTVNLALNRALTLPVGYFTSSGQKRVMVVDELGNARAWRAGPVQEATASLGHLSPLPPAVGVLLPGGAESIVVAFADGTVTALAAGLTTLVGWPVNLGATPAGPPVLCDLDSDGLHEIVIPVLSGDPASLVFRVLEGNGQPAAGDGAVALAPTGGGWRTVSWPAVGGRPDSGELHVGLFGLADNGQLGADAVWELGKARLDMAGQASSQVVPGLRVHATSAQGELNLTSLLISPPLAWNHRGGWGTDLASLVHISWFEELYGLTSFPGLSTAWFVDTGDDDGLSVRRPVLPGGAAAGSVAAVGATLVRVSADLLLRLDGVGQVATITPVADLYASDPLWSTARGDGRNTGAYPLEVGASAAPEPVPVAFGVQVHPNPGTGNFRFRFAGDAGGTVDFEVYDLRGRRVGRVAVPAGAGAADWDGRDPDGRPLPAGTYLVRARGMRADAATRLTIVR
ncbi:MAG: S8 family serine peptidase [bacterium]|nr:S8 family serine peptidase [bacterium]